MLSSTQSRAITLFSKQTRHSRKYSETDAAASPIPGKIVKEEINRSTAFSPPPRDLRSQSAWLRSPSSKVSSQTVTESPLEGFGKTVVKQKKKISDKLYYDPVYNFNIVTNQFYDFDELSQYKNKGAVVEEKDIDAKLSKLKRRSIHNSPDISTQNEPSNRHISDFMGQLRSGGISDDQVLLLRKFFNIQIDHRMLQNIKLGFLKIDSSKSGFMEKETFRSQLLRRFLKSITPDVESLALKVFEEDGKISFKKLRRMVDLFNFYPLALKQERPENRKDPNQSPEVSGVLTVNANPSPHIRRDQIQKFKEQEQDIRELSEYFWIRVEERFHNLAEVFRYFDTNNDGLVSLKDFEIGLDVLNLPLHPDNIQKLFYHLNQSEKEQMTYIDMCKAREERPRQQKSPIPEEGSVHKRANSFSLQESVQRKSSPFGRRDAKYPFELDPNFEFGKKTKRGEEDIKEIMSGGYLNKWLEEQELKKAENLMNQAQKKKVMKVVLTNSSKKRAEAQINRIKQRESSQEVWKLRKFRDVPPSKSIQQRSSHHGKTHSLTIPKEIDEIVEVGDSVSQKGTKKTILPPISGERGMLSEEMMRQFDGHKQRESVDESGLMQKVRVVINSRTMSKRLSPREH